MNMSMNQNAANMLVSYSGNYSGYIKNWTKNQYYGVNALGTLFTLNPEYVVTSGMYNIDHLICGIEVTHYDVETNSYTGVLAPRPLGGKSYKAPCKGYPLYIPEMNVVLFENEAERATQLDLVEKDAVKLVKNYASGLSSVINGSHTSVLALNSDKQFYMLKTAGIEYLPSIDADEAKNVLKKFNLEPEILEAYYVFMISTTIKNNRHSNTTLDTDIKRIPKGNVIKGEPLIMDSTGIVIFEGRESAEDFQKKYRTVTDYISRKCLEVTAVQHEADLEDMNEQAKKDKKGMIDTFMIMGGTSIASILTENVIKVLNSPDSGKSKAKQAMMIFGIGIGAVMSIIGIYNMSSKLKKVMNEKKKDAQGPKLIQAQTAQQ